MNRYLYWIWLRLAFQGNVKMMYALYSVVEDVEKIFRADKKQYVEWGVPATYLAALVDKDLTSAYNILGQCERFNIGILSIEDEQYPENLRQIALPPCLLFYQGDFLKCLKTPMLTVVGTRYATASGEAIAGDFATGLALSGFTVVCGVAQGIEEAIHKAVLSADGKCILLLPCGILSAPKRVRYLMKDVVTHGAVLSEWLPGEKSPYDAYKIRNRLLSALTPGTLILQSPRKSGSQITANYALSQGKDVFTIPGGLLDPSFAGNNILLRDGAIPVLEAMDIVNYYKPKYEDQLADIVIEDDSYEKYVQSISQKLEFENKEQQIVYSVMTNEGNTIDEIVLKSELATHVVLSQLTMMELNGWIKAIPGGKYKIIT